MKKLAFCLLLAPMALAAAPSTFSPVIGNALLCYDQINPGYFRQYLVEAFKDPYKIEGGAYWFKTSTPLFGLTAVEVFVNVEEGDYNFIGVLFDQPLPEARRALLSNAGTDFIPEGDRLRSRPGSYLVGFGNKSKLYCMKPRRL